MFITIKRSFCITFLLFGLIAIGPTYIAARCEDIISDCGTISKDIFQTWYCNAPNCEAVTFDACGSANLGDRCCFGPHSSYLCAGAPTPTNTPTPTQVPPPTPINTPTPPPFSPIDPPTNETFDAVNPLLIGGGDDIDDQEPSQYASQLSTPGGIISRALTFIFPLAGLLLFALLVWGGFEMLIGSPTKKSMESGKNRITAALAGFFLLFATYWIWQIVEVIFGVAIL